MNSDATPDSLATQTLEDYARLSPDMVIDAVEATGRLSDARVLALNSYENRVYQVGMEEGLPVIAKFYRPGRWSDAQIREEHAFSCELAEAELPVVAPLQDAQGETLFFHEGYRFALFTRKGGQAPEPGDAEQLYRMGMLLGRMHAVSEKSAFTARPVLDAASFLHAPVAQVQASGFLPEVLREPYARVTTALAQAIADSGLEKAARLRAHGDLHPGNILWTRDDGPWLVDFDDCRSAPAVQDLWMLLTGSRHEQELQLCDLLEGYETFRGFDNSELGLIEALRSLRMVHYAGWLTQRWSDPAFPRHFPWFNTDAYWRSHVAELQEQLVLMAEPPLHRL